MKTIWADFNARTTSNYVSLNTFGSVKSIKEVGGVKIGEEITISDGELTVNATIITLIGGLFAKPDWVTMIQKEEQDE